MAEFRSNDPENPVPALSASDVRQVSHVDGRRLVDEWFHNLPPQTATFYADLKTMDPKCRPRSLGPPDDDEPSACAEAGAVARERR